MELNRLSFVARQRTPWEVFDLTQLFVRENFINMIKLYLVLVIPLAVFLCLILSSDWALFIIWWLKPILERPLLDYLSKRSFSQHASMFESIKCLKQLKVTDILLTLTIFRLSPNRAYFSPVEQLEKQVSDKATKRKNLLKGRCDHKQFFWMMFCVHLELLLVGVFMLICYNFIPEGVTVDYQFMTQNLISESFQQIYFIIYILAISIIAPLFTAGGFLMYLNSRIQLEGWDIELTFKRIAARLSTAASILIVCIIGLINPTPGYAAAETEKPAVKSAFLTEIKQDVDKIYLDNNLIKKQNVWSVIDDDKEKTEEESSEVIKSFLEFIGQLGPVLSVIFWVFILSIVAWVIWQLYLNRKTWFSVKVKHKPQNTKQIELPDFFTEIEQHSWPEDLLGAAETSLQQAKIREALTFILQFALYFVEKSRAGTCHKSMTEHECERAVLAVLPDKLHAQYKTLFFIWIQQAWAHKSASEHQVIDLIAQFRNLDAEVTF